MYPRIAPLLAVAAALTLAACSSTPERIDMLEDARETVREVSAHPDAQQVAGDEIEDANEALDAAEYLYANNGDYDDIWHYAYKAQRHAEIAHERIAEANTREQIESSEAERNRVLLMAREAEADEAIRMARAQEREAQQAALIAEANAARAEQRAREAELAEQRAAEAIAEKERLQAALLEMEAQKTNRGYVLTLGDILFDTDKSVLKPGADSTLDQLAEFLREYPDRRLLIEGHTDSRGTDSYNISLSRDRANAVRVALLDRGIPAERLDVKALGESFPLASNDTSAGRQENRRVEVIVSDNEGSFPSAAIRTASND